MLRLQTLGGLSLRSAHGAEHPLLSQPKRLALLIYLAAGSSTGYRRRDVLLSLFWPELDDEHARGALRQSVYILRRDLGDGIVRSRGDDELGINPDALWFDVCAFSAAISAERYGEAISLYHGDFLDGYFVAGAAPEFEEWTARERKRLRESASRALWAVAAQSSPQDPAAAISAIRRAIALSPDDEIALRRGIAQLAQLGDRAGALQLYHEFRDRLAREYGAQPSTESKVLGQTLQRSRDPAPLDLTLDVPALDVPVLDVPVLDVPVLDVPALDVSRTDEAAVVATVEHGASTAVSSPRTKRLRVAVASLACLVSLAWIVRSVDMPSLTASGEVTATDELLVADVQAPPGDSLAARAITELLRSSLSTTQFIRVVTRAAQDQTLRRMLLPLNTRLTDTIAREVAVRSGYEAVLLTDLRPVGRGFVLTSRVTTVRGVELTSLTETATSGDALLGAVDRLAKALRVRLGESRELMVSIAPLQQVSTRSLRALSLFTQAQDEARVHGQQPPNVLALLKETIAADSTFAMAHRRIGAAYYNLGLTLESLSAFRAAERFSDKLSDEHRLSILMMLNGNMRNFERAVFAADEVLRHNPQSSMAKNGLPAHRFALGQFDVVEQEMGRGRVLAWYVWNTWTYQGQRDKARDFARQQLRRAHDSTWVNSTRSARNVMARVHSATFAYDSALVYAAPGVAPDSGSPVIVAASFFATGQFRRATAIQTLRARAGDWELYIPHAGAGVESFSALVAAVHRRNLEPAVTQLRRVLKDSTYLALAPVNRPIRPVLALALAGRAADAKHELAVMERGASDDVRRARALDFEYARGAVALAEGRTSDAIAAFTHASTTMTFASLDACRVCALPWLGRAYEMAKQTDSVIAVYERYLAIGDPARMLSDAVWRAHILQRLGQLHLQRGDSGQAARRLSEFRALWKDADPELQTEVTRAARTLAELRRRPVRNALLPVASGRVH